MKNPLLRLLTALLISAASLAGVAHASPDGDDYVAVQVPDVTQAVTFFRDVMNCGVIVGGSTASAADSVTLMTCGRQTTVEISRATGANATGGTSGLAIAAHKPLTLTIDDAAGIAPWLRANHIRLTRSPELLSSGPDAGKVAIGFLAPWGEPLRLIGRIRADDLLPSLTPAARVAVQ